LLRVGVFLALVAVIFSSLVASCHFRADYVMPVDEASRTIGDNGSGENVKGIACSPIHFFRRAILLQTGMESGEQGRENG
jgi:hypothetical protein